MKEKIANKIFRINKKIEETVNNYSSLFLERLKNVIDSTKVIKESCYKDFKSKDLLGYILSETYIHLQPSVHHQCLYLDKIFEEHSKMYNFSILRTVKDMISNDRTKYRELEKQPNILEFVINTTKKLLNDNELKDIILLFIDNLKKEFAELYGNNTEYFNNNINVRRIGFNSVEQIENCVHFGWVLKHKNKEDVESIYTISDLNIYKEILLISLQSIQENPYYTLALLEFVKKLIVKLFVPYSIYSYCKNNSVEFLKGDYSITYFNMNSIFGLRFVAVARCNHKSIFFEHDNPNVYDFLKGITYTKEKTLEEIPMEFVKDNQKFYHIYEVNTMLKDLIGYNYKIPLKDWSSKSIHPVAYFSENDILEVLEKYENRINAYSEFIISFNQWFEEKYPQELKTMEIIKDI